ncbi:uncharacterized protein LOC115620875 isoform X2 [Scaptodrosophila lebanonensis]|uniref:Uncharacterized protein LOC115620875 isoform X2 n=1 Tax=Drosophila lebanonensis TaxID=7225 RepID=A0A6J2T5K2_DROLE|nr:uncharacterized protein LOC115620875 isoform X2 [Scaptodrosophila lebanonensis]
MGVQTGAYILDSTALECCIAEGHALTVANSYEQANAVVKKYQITDRTGANNQSELRELLQIVTDLVDQVTNALSNNKK